jgi:hypothetical protein
MAAASEPPRTIGSSPQPVYTGAENLHKFCRAVIGQISEHHVGRDRLGKAALHQQLWFLVAKYEVPIADPADDIVVVVDKLCRDDDSLAESLNTGEFCV